MELEIEIRRASNPAAPSEARVVFGKDADAAQKEACPKWNRQSPHLHPESGPARFYRVEIVP